MKCKYSLGRIWRQQYEFTVKQDWDYKSENVSIHPVEYKGSNMSLQKLKCKFPVDSSEG